MRWADNLPVSTRLGGRRVSAVRLQLRPAVFGNKVLQGSRLLRKRLVLLGPDPANGSHSTWNYFRSCADELCRFAPTLEIVAKSPADERGEDAQAGSRLGIWARNYFEWPLRLRGLKADAFHIVDQGLAWYGLALPKGLRFVTVHDLILYLTCLGKLPFMPISSRRKFLVLRNMSEIRRADHVFAISNFTASSIMEHLGVEANRITVTPNYADRRFKPLCDTERLQARARLFGKAEHVIVCVANSFEYKNRLAAFQVLKILHAHGNDVQLHIAGGGASEKEETFLQQSSMQQYTHYWGPISLNELNLFYNAADVFLCTSSYEGFGLPPLEAMQCGCPVVSTTCASLGEVVGSAALTVDDPQAVETMAHHVEAILKDHNLRKRLRDLGFSQASKFSLDRSMQGITEVYRRFLT